MNEQYSTTTHCVGRFLIDLPSSAEFVGSTDQYAFTKIDIKQATAEEFEGEVAALEARLRSTKHETNGNLLIRKVDRSAASRIFAFYAESFIKSAVDLEGYHWDNGFRYLLHSVVDPNEVQDGTVFMSGVMAKLRSSNGKLQMEKGFCIRGALFADNDESDDEETAVSFKLKDHPDVMISVSTTRNSGAPPETLLSRKPGMFSALNVLGAAVGGIRNLRERDRVLNGIPGQEWLLRAPNDYKFQSHLFTWEAQGRTSDTLHPQIRIELSSAGYGRGVPPGEASLTDEQAMQLWDRILSSLRIRPSGGVDSTGATTTPVIERGHLATAGEKCPASGWWMCTDAPGQTQISGGHTRYLREGETVPQAVLLLPLGPWQKIRGEQQTYESPNPSGWKLVDRRKTQRMPLPKFVAPAGGSNSLASATRDKFSNSVEQMASPIGTNLASGATCSATGWWQCLEAAAVDGTRWFQKGVVLPPATKSAALTIIDKFKGMPEFVRVSADWRLVRVTHFDNASFDAPENTDVPPAPTSGSVQGTSDV